MGLGLSCHNLNPPKIYGGFSNIKPGQLYVPKSTFDFLNEFRLWCRKQDFQTSKTFQFCLTQQIMFKSNPITKELVALLKKSDFMTFFKMYSMGLS